MTTVLLNNVDHNDLHVITRHGPEFGDAVSQVLVFPTEFESVQREYPIVFRRDAEGALRPVALLGLSRDENLFLDGAGGWRSSYIPALLQRGPFSIGAPDTAEGEPMIRIDLEHPRVSRSEGTPIFLPQGGNSAYLEHIAGVLRTIYVGHHLLDPMIAAFEGAGLLQPVNLEARVSETEVAAAQRFAFSHLRLVVEPGGAAALAAVLAGKVSMDGRTAIVLSGGNVDAARFAQVIAATH